MFKRILIANRGEIAVRIIRCCREMGIDSVAVYSTADADALHVQLATDSICIGSEKAADSYLNMQNILSAALCMGCDAIHPGFGFLSENSEFARMCAQCGICFIGPDAQIIDKMGNKAAARALMLQSGVPVVPGSDGSVENAAQAAQIAEQIGYPVLIKAAAGGGGRGMRKAFTPQELEAAYNSAKAEAIACFGDGEMYMEKLILNPRHIEFQIIGDQMGNIVHLGERDCSIQRKNQKLLEESPSKALSDELRARMGAHAVQAARAAGYFSVGTVEFVLAEDGSYYFIEMNTRIQVEHPVTEAVTGIDLIKAQISVAAGLPLSFTQQDITLRGHSIECRINAEDPENGFRPSPGKVNFLHFPGGNGVRIDSALYPGYEACPFYDSMVAKIIVHAPTRLEAIRKMRRALEELVIDGIQTNADLSHLILYHPDFVKGRYDTAFLEKNLDTLLQWGQAGGKDTSA